MIICNNQLNNKQFNALHELTALCREQDGGTPTFYNHLLAQKRLSDNNVLYLREGRLIAFLSVYFFYEDACEVSLTVAPNVRRQGIAKQLLHTILPLLIAKGIKNLIFSSPATVNDQWLEKQGFTYRNSEYHMERMSYEPILTPFKEMVVHKATIRDIPKLCEIDEVCFPTQTENMRVRFQSLLNDSNYTLFLGLDKENTAVAKAHILWQSKEAIFSDIAVLPHYQKRGLGGAILVHCINHALELGKNKLMLDVESGNRNALSLYIKYNFKTTNISDYWVIPLQTLAINWQV